MFHVKHEGWDDLASSLHVPLSADMREKLGSYERLLLDRAVPLGMIGSGDVPALRSRHIADALRAVTLIPRGAAVIDLGSGAGIPGVPLAIARPDLVVTLTELRRKRAAFLELVLDEIDLPGTRVHFGRAEDLPRRSDMCVARAFASLRGTWEVADRLLRADGTLLYWAGAGAASAPDVPAGTSIRTFTTSTLAETGAIVIMTRQ
jgi:16S rRNA (guanine527-N7)-methyltransferase